MPDRVRQPGVQGDAVAAADREHDREPRHGDRRDGGGDEATARRAGTVPRGDGGDGGSTRRGRAGTAGPGPPGTVPARVPAAERPGAENTGVTGAGGRFGAVCGRGAAENAAGGTGPVAGRLGVAGVGALLNAADAGRPAGAGEAAGAGWWENRAGGNARPAAAVAGVAGAGALLNAGAPAVPAGEGSGVWAAGALLNAAGPTGAGAGRGRPCPACRGGRGGLGG